MSRSVQLCGDRWRLQGSSKIGGLESLIRQVRQVDRRGMMLSPSTRRAACGGQKAWVGRRQAFRLGQGAEAKARPRSCSAAATDVRASPRLLPTPHAHAPRWTRSDGWMGLGDITAGFTPGLAGGLGPTAKKRDLERGPMGVFEFRQIAPAPTVWPTPRRAERTGCCTIIGGGDSVAAVRRKWCGGEK